MLKKPQKPIAKCLEPCAMQGTVAVCGCDVVPPDMLLLEGVNHRPQLCSAPHAQAHMNGGNRPCTAILAISAVTQQKRNMFPPRYLLWHQRALLAFLHQCNCSSGAGSNTKHRHEPMYRSQVNCTISSIASSYSCCCTLTPASATSF